MLNCNFSKSFSGETFLRSHTYCHHASITRALSLPPCLLCPTRMASVPAEISKRVLPACWRNRRGFVRIPTVTPALLRPMIWHGPILNCQRLRHLIGPLRTQPGVSGHPKTSPGLNRYRRYRPDENETPSRHDPSPRPTASRFGHRRQL